MALAPDNGTGYGQLISYWSKSMCKTHLACNL